MPVRRRIKQKGAFSSSSNGSMEGERGAVESKGVRVCGKETIWKEYDGSTVIKTFKKREDFDKEVKVAQYLAKKGFSYNDYNYAFGICEDLQLQLPFVNGVNLNKFKKNLGENRLSIDIIFNIMNILCNNVANLLSSVIYHNDLHPKNIMIVQDGNTYHPVIIDFGETVINNKSNPPRLKELIISLKLLWNLRDNRFIKLEFKDTDDSIQKIQERIQAAFDIYNQNTPRVSTSSRRRSPTNDDESSTKRTNRTLFAW